LEPRRDTTDTQDVRHEGAASDVRPTRSAVLAGLALVILALVWPHVARAATYVNRAGEAYGLQPVPALAVLCALYAYHQHGKRRRDESRALDSTLQARAARSRVEELERLVAFSEALLRAQDEDAIRAVTQAHVPALVPATQVTAAPGVSGGPVLPDGDSQVLRGARDLLTAALQNSESYRRVYENSRQDALTGCFNRTHALESLESEIRRTSRSGSALSVVLFDLDHFKAINDQFGHVSGDEVLAAVGARIKGSTRTSDVKCRYGGEEFLVILPDTPLAGARQVAENLRAVIAKEPVASSGGDIRVTASFGVTQVVRGEIDALAIVTRADVAMYQAKRQGRNAVAVVPTATESAAVAAGQALTLVS
jgi:diguanylate cyclase (GGDEF)-like protein